MLKYFKILYYLFYRPKIFYPKKSYSMFGEDIFLQKYFKNKTYGNYIDVGCYHPLDGSNTHLLYQKGWMGINLDINYYSIKLFNFLRKRDFNIHSGVSDKKRKLVMYYRKEINMLNTINKEIAKVHFRNGFNKKNVRVNTLNFFIKKFKFTKGIDLVNIDTEGNEMNVLKSFNINLYKPKLICIEIHNTQNMYSKDYKYLKTNEIYKYLIKKNYKVSWKNKYSFIFEKK